MKVLIIGGGGREHALAWKIAESPRVDQIFVAPGNAGTAAEVENIHIPADDYHNLLQFAERNNIGLTVVGPEVPLAGGLSTSLKATGNASSAPPPPRPDGKEARSFASRC